MVKSRHKIFFYIVVPLLWVSYGIAPTQADISVSLSVDRTEATLSDRVKLMVKIDGDRNAPSPNISGLEPFHVKSSGTFSRLQNINGKVSSVVDYTFHITPKKKGTFVIGPAEVSIKGKEYQSQTVSLKIKDAVTSEGEKTGSLFATAEMSKNTGYVGEAFMYVLKFYRAQKAVSNVSLVLPQVGNLTFKQLGDHTEYTTSWQGRNFTVIELKYTISTDKPGSYAIPPTLVNMKVHEARTLSQWDSFFNIIKGESVSVGSNPVDLTVKALPQEGRPSGFSELVGQFSFTASLSPKEVKMGESSTLTAKVFGRGDPRLIPDIQIPAMDHLKMYADQPTLSIEATPQGESGTKTMKWAIVPQKEGAFVIPSLSLGFFDPESERYLVRKTDPLTLQVIPGLPAEEVSSYEGKTAISQPLKKEIEIQALDILAIHERPEVLKPDRTYQLNAAVKGSFLLIPPFIFLLILGIKRYQVSNKDQGRAARAKKAAAKFYRHIKALQSTDALLNLGKVTNLYFNERLGLRGGSLTSLEVYNILVQKGVDTKLAGEARDILSNMETCFYAGQETGDNIEKIKENLTTVIKKIDRNLP